MYSGIIYCAKFPNRKKYYGKTKNDLNERIKKHYGDANVDNLLFHKALKKYKDDVKWIIIETIEASTEEDLINKLNDREIYWIEKDKTFVLKYGIKYGYNLSAGGDGGDTFSGRKHSTETKRKMSASAKRRYLYEKNYFYRKSRPEHSEKMKGENNPMYGKPRSEEVKNKIKKTKKINKMLKTYNKILEVLENENLLDDKEFVKGIFSNLKQLANSPIDTLEPLEKGLADGWAHREPHLSHLSNKRKILSLFSGIHFYVNYYENKD